jgi:predicted transcriptional regulator of viral defense system
MNKKEHIYKEILKEKVVNTNDLKKISKEVLGQTDNKYLYRKYIAKLLKEKKIGKIKRGLYYSIPLDNTGEEFEVDRFLLSNKIKQGYALGYHSALELHGAAYSSFNSIYILVQKKDRFRLFDFQNVKYVPVINNYYNHHLKLVKYKNKNVSVTDPARTFVECLDRIDLCGGWEECLKSLANLREVKISDILEILGFYKNKTLELKTGYLLELFSKNSPYYSHIKKEELEPLRPADDWIPVYVDRQATSKLRKKWGLYLPEDFDELLRGI